MNKKLEGKIVTLLNMDYKEAVSDAFFKILFEGRQLEQIEDRYYLESPPKGISLVICLKMNIIAVHLYSNGVDNYKEYAGDRINDLSFNMSQEQVHNIFGQPKKSGKAKISPILGQRFPWDLYEFDNASLHCEYSKDYSKIRLITIELPE